MIRKKIKRKRIKVLYGGAFDLLHYAHVLAIAKAKTYGDYLVMEISPDKRVRKKKGKNKPIISGEERAEIIRALRDVDEVVHLPNAVKNWFPELLDLVKPDIILLNEGEIKPEQREECLKRGIKIIPFPRIKSPSGLTTGGIIEKCKKVKKYQSQNY